MITTLTVGDWSNDGHGKIALYFIDHNLASTAQLKEAYTEGSKKLGILVPYYGYRGERVCEDVMGRLVAEGYEDSGVPDEVVKALTAVGLGPDAMPDLPWYEPQWDNEDLYVVGWHEGFCRMWTEIAKLGAPELEYKILRDYNNINVGGYGLFY